MNLPSTGGPLRPPLRQLSQGPDLIPPPSGPAPGTVEVPAETADPKSKRPTKAASAEDKPSQQTGLLKLLPLTQTFHTPDGEGYVRVPSGGHWEVYATKSKALRQWLSLQYYRSEHSAPSPVTLQSIIEVLDGRAKFGSPEKEVHVRVAGADNTMYLDLGDPDWRVVKVTPTGWKVLARSSVQFRRPRGMLALPIPVSGGSISDLRPLINGTCEENWILAVAWLIGALRPMGPYPVLDITGEQGSAKTTLSRMLKTLIDPGRASARSAPKDERDLMIAARNAHALAFDNLSGIPHWLSDAFCRLSTGGGLSTRELYADQDEIIFEATRPMALNGIDDIALRSDLLDRSLVLMLPQIPEEQRLTEHDIWEKFRSIHASILGALLDAVSLGLREFRNTDLGFRPRMLDFAQFVVAAEARLPWSPGGFLTTYETNRRDVVRASLDGDPLADAIRNLARLGRWNGTATELLKRLGEHARGGKLPRAPRSLSSELRRKLTFLSADGINVRFERLGKDRTRIITIEQSAESTSATSAASAKVDNPSSSNGLG